MRIEERSKGRKRLGLRRVLFLSVLAASAPWALAQHPGGGPPGVPASNMPPPYGTTQPSYGGPAGAPAGSAVGPPPGSTPTTSTLRGGLQLGPPGRWWDDAGFARSLGIDKDQQHRMDDIFKANKGDLVRLFKALQHEESQLEKLTRAKKLDETQIDAQIDRVVVARGELEKANVHMLLQIRNEMTPEQNDKLEEHRPVMSPSEN